jgi:uncharacterized membrane protein
LLFLPASDVIKLDMTVEDAAKLVISAGLVYPQKTKSGQIIASADSDVQNTSKPKIH